MNCQVAFYKGNSETANGIAFDKIIRRWTHGPYSHSEIILNGKMYSSSPRDGGVRSKVHKYDPDKWDYIKLSDIYVQNIKFFYKLTENEPYDWLGILGFVVPLKDKTRAWFCSEWCANALKVSGCKKLFAYEPSKLSPNKLYKILTT